jgi:pyrroloquinoline quinone biosynthesis protein E
MKWPEVSVDVTYQCPFHCPFCSTAPRNELGEMSLGVARGCARFLQRLSKRFGGPVTVAVTGGEPTAAPSLLQYFRLWSKRGNYITLCTTGAVRRDGEYWCRLASSGLRTVRLSLHTVSNEKARLIFGTQYSLQTVEENIKAIVSSGVALHINFVVSEISRAGVAQIVQFCAHHGATKFRLLGLARQGRALKNWQRISVCHDEQLEVAQGAAQKCARHGLAIELAGMDTGCSHSDPEGNCLGGYSFFHVNTDGDIYPCPAMKSIREHRIGSVLDLTHWHWAAQPSEEHFCRLRAEVSSSPEEDHDLSMPSCSQEARENRDSHEWHEVNT